MIVNNLKESIIIVSNHQIEFTNDLFVRNYEKQIKEFESRNEFSTKSSSNEGADTDEMKPNAFLNYEIFKLFERNKEIQKVRIE